MSRGLTTLPPVLAVCGVDREARIAASGEGVVAIPGGSDPVRLEAQLRAAAARGAAGIASFGLAGALAPDLRVGDWVTGTGVTGGCNHATHPAWAAALAAALATAETSVHSGLVHADGMLVSSAQAKRALHAASGALAVDMESHIAARVAAGHGLPFAILRVISDSAEDVLPPAFAVAMTPAGGTDIAAMLLSLARRPSQLPAFVRAARNGSAALGALLRGYRGLGLRLALPDLGERLGDVV